MAFHFPLSALSERSKTTRTTDGEIKRRSEQDNAGCKMRGKQCGDTRGNGGRAGAVGLPKVPAHGMGWNPQGRDEGRVDNLGEEEPAAAPAPATEAAARSGKGGYSFISIPRRQTDGFPEAPFVIAWVPEEGRQDIASSD